MVIARPYAEDQCLPFRKSVANVPAIADMTA
jgi:hypothetical protein